MTLVIAPPDALVQLFKPWADYFGHSKAVETIVQFLHIGGLLLAGGLGVAMDRATVRMLREPVADRRRHLTELAAVHRWVLTGLAVIVVSGLALLTADLETFFGSWIYWTKMALVVALLANGYRMTQIERALQVDASEATASWARLHQVAVVSMVLWFTIALAGVALVNLA